MKDRYKKVAGDSHLYKDIISGAIINTNEKEIERARIRKKLRMQKAQEEAELKTEVKQLRSDIAALTQLVKEMVE
jgi:hypothetical protein